MGQTDPEIDIRIRTSGVSQSKRDIQEVAKEAKGLGEAAKSSQTAKTALMDIEKEAKTLGEAYQEAGGGIRGVFAAIGVGAAEAAAAVAGVAAAVGGFISAVRGYGEAEEKIRKLQAALAQAGSLTEKVNRDYQELIATLQDRTGIAGSEWTEVLTRLTQFGATPDDINKHVEAVKNLAGVMGGDLQSAATAIARAMQGSYDMFARWGIIVEQSGTQAEKLDGLYRQLAQRGAGQLEAASDSLNGQFRRLKNSMGDVLQAIGGQIASTGILQLTLQSLTFVLGAVADRYADVVRPAENMTNAVGRSAKQIDEAQRANLRFNESLKEMAQRHQDAADAADRRIQKERELARLQDEQADSETAIQLAAVDLAEAQKHITGPEATGRRALIRLAADRGKQERAEAAREKERQLLADKVDIASRSQQELEDAVLTAEKQANQSAKNATARSGITAYFEERERLAKSLTDSTGEHLPVLVNGKFVSIADLARQKIDQLESEKEKRLARFPVDESAASRLAAAKQARDAALPQNEQAVRDAAGQFGASMDESRSAGIVYRNRSKATALQTAADITKAVGGGNVDVSQWIAVMLQQTGAFQTSLNTLGSTATRTTETMLQAIMDTNNRLKTLEKQVQKLRN